MYDGAYDMQRTTDCIGCDHERGVPGYLGLTRPIDGAEVQVKGQNVVRRPALAGEPKGRFDVTIS